MWSSSICHAVARQDPAEEGEILPPSPAAARGLKKQGKSEQSKSTPPAIEPGGSPMPEGGMDLGAAQDANPATTRKRVVRKSARGAEAEKEGAIAVGR